MEDYILINDMFNKHYQSNDDINWYEISKYEILTEEFIEKYSDKLDWCSVSIYQCLTEILFDKYSNKINWDRASQWQMLNEKLIEKFYNNLNFEDISIYQNLSEDFIDRHKNDLDWHFISKYQKLSERFIKKNSKYVYWNFISRYQKLSENFIKDNIDSLNISYICKYQKLSEHFINNFLCDKIEDEIKNKLIKDNWIYKSAEEKKQEVIKTGLYECHDDYFIAYKAIRLDRYSLFNFQYKYEIGGIYDTWCDCSDEEDSFGFSVGTENFAISYGSTISPFMIVKCKIRYEDVGRIVHYGKKVRCFKIEVLD